MRLTTSAILALGAAAAMSMPQQAQSVWRYRPTSKPRPLVLKMVGGTDAEINAWNEAVEARKAAKKGVKA